MKLAPEDVAERKIAQIDVIDHEVVGKNGAVLGTDVDAIENGVILEDETPEIATTGGAIREVVLVILVTGITRDQEVRERSEVALDLGTMRTLLDVLE